MDKYAASFQSESYSLFWDRFIDNFQIPYVWIPLIVVLLYIIIKNNKLQVSLLAITIPTLGTALASLLDFRLCGVFVTIAFIVLLIKSRELVFMLIGWGTISSYIFFLNNVVPVIDTVIQAMAGVFVGSLLYFLYKFLLKSFSSQTKYISNQYTSTGYLVRDIMNLHTVMLLTYFYLIIWSLKV